MSPFEILAYFVLAIIAASVMCWAGFNVAIMVRGRVSACPRCGARRTRRARARLFDRLTPAYIVARRCESCRKRFYTLAQVADKRRRAELASTL